MRHQEVENESTEKRVPVEDLRPGMYVCRLDRPWLESPFLLQGFVLQDWDDVQEVQAACTYVYVETTHDSEHEAEPAPGLVGNRIPSRAHRPARRPAGREPHPSEAEMVLEEAGGHGGGGVQGKPPEAHARRRPTVPLRQEMQAARPLVLETRKLVARQVEAARNGHSLDTPAARECVTEITESVLRNPDALICLSGLKERDEYTYLHSLSVCILSVAFGHYLGLPRESLLELGFGAFLHDIGKTLIPDSVLNKPARLTEEEFAVMRKHPEYGVEIVTGSERIPESSREVIYSHHERLDGSGYTQGKAGSRIHPLVPLVSVCDTYDAIISHRPYAGARSPLDATAELYRGRGRTFEAELVFKFIGFIGIYPVGSLVELRTGEVGVVVAATENRLRPRLLILLGPHHDRLASPYHLDLSRQLKTADGQPLEIRRALEAGAHGLYTRELTGYMEA